MKISGFVKLSTIDYPSMLSSVIFTQGCNFDCYFCHNRQLIPCGEGSIQEEEVLAYLTKRAQFIEGVVISGGEPCIQKDLADFIRKIKAIKSDYKIKLDTNGSFPEVVSDLIFDELLDYVALDYKAPWDKYKKVCGEHADSTKIQETLSILNRSKIGWELRTTMIPGLDDSDYDKMSQELNYRVATYRFNRYRHVDSATEIEQVSPPIDNEQELKNLYKKISDNVIIN